LAPVPSPASRVLVGDLNPKRWWLLGLCLICTFMTVMDIGIAVVALPSIGHALRSGPDQVQWVISGYALTFGIVPTIAGRLGDDLGQRPVLAMGICGFSLLSLMSGLAPTALVLVTGRILQGATAGLIQPQVVGLVHRTFFGRERGTAFGLVGLATAIGTAAGPVLGGLILFAAGPGTGWRVLFLINVPFGCAALAMCLTLTARKPRKRPRVRLDVVGVILLSVGLFGLLFSAIELNTHIDYRLALIAVVALVILAVLYRWEAGGARRRGFPLIDVDLFGIPTYRNGVAIAFLYSAGYQAEPLLLTLFLQEGLRFTPLGAGLAAAPVAVGAALSAPLAGRLLQKAGRRLVVRGLVLFTAGTTLAAITAVAVTRVAPSLMGLAFIAPFFIAGIGGGWVLHPNQALTLEDIDVAHGSAAGGLIQAGQRLGGAIGTAVSSTVFYLIASTAGRLPGSAHDRIYSDGFAVASAMVAVFTAMGCVIAARDARNRR